MKFKCPSCKMRWQDAQEPFDQISTPLCVFCSTHPIDRELLEWQLGHVKDLDEQEIIKLLPRMYRVLMDEIEKARRPYGNDSGTSSSSGSKRRDASGLP